MSAPEKNATAAREPARVVLALGANIGNPDQALRAAAQAIAADPGIEVIAASHLYRTDPVGGPEQPAYANAVMIVLTTSEAPDLLRLAQRIEQDWGRVREIRWGPRTLDVDIIAYGDAMSDNEDLTLPHPRAHERAFVLVPWLEADAAATLAGHGSVADLIAGLDLDGVVMTDVQLI
jgi:2-amino-4-hydroxy-6-hydroxymethyldihydropteridine diphosphokinase